LQALERRIERLEGLEPAVMRSEIQHLGVFLEQIEKDVAGLRRVLMGFVVTFALTAITLTVTLVTHGKI
jgi:hypothetical protein